MGNKTGTESYDEKLNNRVDSKVEASLDECILALRDVEPGKNKIKNGNKKYEYMFYEPDDEDRGNNHKKMMFKITEKTEKGLIKTTVLATKHAEILAYKRLIENGNGICYFKDTMDYDSVEDAKEEYGYYEVIDDLLDEEEEKIIADAKSYGVTNKKELSAIIDQEFDERAFDENKSLIFEEVTKNIPKEDKHYYIDDRTNISALDDDVYGLEDIENKFDTLNEAYKKFRITGLDYYELDEAAIIEENEEAHTMFYNDELENDNSDEIEMN